jgi:rhizoxin synthesis polyketide synthase RhiC
MGERDALDAGGVQRFLIAELAGHLGIEASTIDPRTPFSDYDVDSLKSVNLVVDLERKIGLKLPVTLLWDYPSIQTLSVFLAEELKMARDSLTR